MKKIFLLLFAAACAVASWAQSTVSATVKGQELTVALANDEQSFVAFQMDITLPAGVDVESTGAVKMNTARLTEKAGEPVPGAADANFIIAYNKIDATHVRVLAYNLENRALVGNSGALFTMTFTGSTSENFTVDNSLFVTTTDLAEIKLAIAESVASGVVLGDVNKSGGDPNGNDLVALVEIIKNHGACPADKDYDMVAANVNESADPVPNGNDVVALIELLKVLKSK